MPYSKFNELTRVQLPALVHLTRLGYEYVGKISEESAGTLYDPDTNILIDVFEQQFNKLNPEHVGEAKEYLKTIRQELDNDDLGKSFYQRLTKVSPIKLIDFDNPQNNVFSCTGEFTCKNGQDEFRPDITMFINGMPLAFLEVKKPNNVGGIVAEAERMTNQRFPNKKFRRFINITQLMLFSNNMEYDAAGGIVPIQGVFYCTGSKGETKFNCFREENPGNANIAPFNENYKYNDIEPEIEKKILTDFNCQVLHNAPEYQTNLEINTPTNRVLTSMCCPERFLFLVQYGIAYVNKQKEIDGKIEVTEQKHIMRYQQLFASLAVIDKLDNGVKSGVIWHTQGSGKTALSYHLNYVLTDYFAKSNKVAKFYFIVDRLDLLKQATEEFQARGLKVHTANSRKELMEEFRNQNSLTDNNKSGEREITVVNIQRFAEDKEKVELPSYAINLQRIFIIDEAHRGYNPKGSFLANLFDADPNSIKIALTGTPLLAAERSSWKVFGEYLHTYYYDKSIQDGYTLKIIREDIETSYKEKLNEVYDSIEHLVQKKDVKKEFIIEHDTYVKELLKYIISDLRDFRLLHNDDSLGGMIICETSGQARNIYKYFDEVQNELNNSTSNKSHFKAGLVLYDSDDKETKDKIIKDFKDANGIDMLIVYNMLLTGFDAPRLKRLYFGRKLKDHNLLQAITRVNRPYKDNRYGYVIDFADIKKNFDETNEDYLKELNRFNSEDEVGKGNATDTFVQVLESKDEIITKVKEAQQVLFRYTTDNLEVFSSEISAIDNKDVLLNLRRVLVEARDCVNIVRTFGDDDLKATFAKIDLGRMPEMISEITRHIENLNQKLAFAQDEEQRIIINEAMADIKFDFKKVGQDELKIISGGAELQEKWKHTIDAFTQNIDQEDPEYITLKEAFVQRFKEHGFVINTIDDYNRESKALDEVIDKLDKLHKSNLSLAKKYNGDVKFLRVHKRIKEENEQRQAQKCVIISAFDIDVLNALTYIKTSIDQQVYDKDDILKKDIFFEKTVRSLTKKGVDMIAPNSTHDDREFIVSRITKEYLSQYNATYSYSA